MSITLEIGENVEFTRELVPAQGIIDFVYPLGGNLLMSAELGEYRSGGAGDAMVIPDSLPPVNENDLLWLRDSFPHIHDPRAVVAVLNWVQASMIDNGTQDYLRLYSYIDDRVRELGYDLFSQEAAA